MYIYIFMRRISLTFYLLVSTLKTTKPTDKNYSVFGGDRQRYSSVRLYSLEAVYLNGGYDLFIRLSRGPSLGTHDSMLMF